MVVVGSLSAHVDHAVDRGTPSNQLAPRVGEGPAIQAFFGRCGIAPVGSGIAHAIEVTNRDVDPVVIVRAARFDQQNAVS